MSNGKVFKNNQVNIGMPFQIKNPIIYKPPIMNPNIKIKIDTEESEDIEEVDYKALGEEIINKAKAEADMIIKEALLEAKDIMSKAHADIEELSSQAINEARQTGYDNGIVQAQEEYRRLIDEAETIKKQAGLEYEKILESLESDTVNVILDIAKKVISQELKCKENILLLVRDAFEKCAKDRKAVLKLSEQDYETINENKEELISILERSEEIEIKKDLSLKEGGCVIDTPYGSIDASAETKLKNIENDFKAILNEKLN